MDFGFKFEIGQTVKHVAQDLSPKYRVQWQREESQWFIVSRLLEQCPGGVQRHYVCRGVSSYGVVADYIKFNEVELEKILVTENKPGSESPTT